MLAKDWIRKAQSNGWNVHAIEAAQIVLSCSAHGCHGRHRAFLDSLGHAPAACALPHQSGFSRPAYDQYEAMVDELRRRRVQIGLDQNDLNAVMGVADSYVNKLEAGHRIASPPMLLLWAQALGLEITFRITKLPNPTAQAIQDRIERPYEQQKAQFKK